MRGEKPQKENAMTIGYLPDGTMAVAIGATKYTLTPAQARRLKALWGKIGT